MRASTSRARHDRHSIDEDSAVREIAPGRFECTLSSGWWGPLAPHGGYLSALLLRACAQASGAELDPVHVSVRFVSRAEPGEAFIDVESLGGGRQHRFLEATMVAGGNVIACASAIFGSERSQLAHRALHPPGVPDVEACSEWLDRGWDCSVLHRYEARPTEPVRLFEGAEVAQTSCWLRLTEEHRLDAFALAVLADAWIPPIFVSLDAAVHVAPTLAYSLWFADVERHRDGDWVLGCFRAESARGGYVVEDGEIWSRGGELLVKCQQVAVVVDSDKGEK